MSLETWVEEFYPISADSLSESTDIECLEHSMQKWQGFTNINLTKHDVIFAEIEKFLYSSCSLCEKYPISCEDNYQKGNKCPIIRSSGHACDHSDMTEEEIEDKNMINPWRMGSYNKNPLPMIELLASTFDYVLEEDKKEK